MSQKIEDLIPHRAPFLFVDEIISYTTETIIGLKTFTQKDAWLQGSFPDFNFVPVYWMASEDHDFAEINHFKTENNYEKTENKSGIGLKNLNRRLELIYPNQHELAFSVTENVYQAQLILKQL